MRVLQTKEFKKWNKSENLSNEDLSKAIAEIENGLIDAHLGGGLVKKRIAIGSSGKSSGTRTLIAYKKGQKAFFLYGFKKNEISNIDASELKTLKRLGDMLMARSDAEINLSIEMKLLYEVSYEKEGK